MRALLTTPVAAPRPGRRRRLAPTIFRLPLLALLAVLTLAAFAACSESVQADPAEPEGSAGQPPDAHRLVVTVVADDAAGAAALEERVRGGGFFRWYANRLEGWQSEIRRGELSAVAGGPPQGAPDIEVMVGLLPLPEVVRSLAAALPVALDGPTVALAGTSYPAPSTTVAVRLPPAGEGAERWLVAGGTAEAVGEAADQALFQAVRQHQAAPGEVPRVDYVVQESRWLQRTGTWRSVQGGGEARWATDPATEQDQIAERDRWLRELVPIDGAAVRLLVSAGSEKVPELRALAVDLGNAADAMAGRLGVGAGEGRALALSPDRPVTIVVEDDYVAQIRHTGAMGVAVEGGGADLHAVLHQDDLWALRHALARRLLERAGLAAERPVWAVEGTALWLAGYAPAGASAATPASWYGRPYRDWLPALVAAGALPSGAELLAAEREGADSAPLWTPVAAAVVEDLPGTTAVAKLAAFAGLDEFGAAGRLAALRETVARTGTPEAPTAVAAPKGFLRGISLAHPNNLEGGYHAPFVDQRLAELRTLGADSVSLMPFAYQRDPRAPEMVFLNRTPLSEHDTGTIHAARAAHARGLSVLWKPHIWVAHDSWPGDIEMDSEEEWAAWWRLYRRFVLHHSMLARYAGADLFSVGVELERTVERPEWVGLIDAVRQIYPGPVTYAANWGSGADRARFWDRLDLVGVDAYYPLTGSEDQGSAEQLAAGAARVAARLRGLSERTGKPVILTEVGFAARRAAWTAPHEQGGEYSGEDQARSYDALFGALRESMVDGGWLRGVYVWKAFSGDRAWRVAEADFRFLGRPAEQVVARYFHHDGMTTGVAAGGMTAGGTP